MGNVTRDVYSSVYGRQGLARASRIVEIRVLLKLKSLINFHYIYKTDVLNIL